MQKSKAINIFLVISLLLFSLIAQTNNVPNPNNIDFKFIDINGKIWQKSALKGQYIIVNFWATWCPPCLEEIPLLVDFAQDDDVTVLGINHWDDVGIKALQNFIELYYVDYPIIQSEASISNQKSVTNFGKISGIPTTFVFDKQGKFIEKIEGQLTQKILLKTLKRSSK